MSQNTQTAAAYRLEFHNGRPCFVSAAGEVIPPSTYCDCIVSPPEEWIARNQDFVESGVHIYFLSEVQNWTAYTNQYWTGDGEYPVPGPGVFCFDREAEAILAMDPDARFFVRFSEMVPNKWAEVYPDEISQSFTGQRFTALSWASDIGLDHYCQYLRHVIAYCESRRWADRVMGYMLFPVSEGQTLMSHMGFAFDVSPAMQRAYRAYVEEKYATAEALRAAWGDPDVSFDTVRVPTDAEWRARRDHLLHFPEPGQMARERDYFDLQRVLCRRFFRTQFAVAREATAHRPVMLGIDAFKQPMLGWRANRAVDGSTWVTDPMIDWPELTLASGAVDIGDMLDDEGWQLVATPADYTARTVGFGWEAEGVSDSLLLRGKLQFVENDARTWVGKCSETLGAFRTPEEARAGLLRNTAWALTRGQLHYWMNVGSSFFHDPKVHEVAIRDERRMLDASPNWPHVETEHAVCFVLDDSGPRHEDGTGGFQQIACLWQRHLGLTHCGIPYRVYLFSDLEKDNMPAYRTYFFPNLFELNDARYALLREKVLRDGRMVIFGPATGITDGTRLTADWISRLLDAEFELTRQQAPRRVLVNHDHPITQNLPTGTVIGDSYAFGPILLPSRAAVNSGAVTALGNVHISLMFNRPGLLLKEFGRGGAGNGSPGPRGADDYAILWSAAIPLPAALLREAARYGGCHIWCEEDDVVLASDTIAALHSIKPGPRTLKFPTPRTVWDLLSGERMGAGMREVTFDVTPPETRLFYFGEEGPY